MVCVENGIRQINPIDSNAASRVTVDLNLIAETPSSCYLCKARSYCILGSRQKDCLGDRACDSVCRGRGFSNAMDGVFEEQFLATYPVRFRKIWQDNITIRIEVFVARHPCADAPGPVFVQVRIDGNCPELPAR